MASSPTTPNRDTPRPPFHSRNYFPLQRSGGVTYRRFDVIPLPETSLDPGARLYRTCLSLLESLHRYDGWGALTQYKKCVLHDDIVPRETYQDLFLVMRERHKHLINEWREVTDPLKHVFEVRSAVLSLLHWTKTLIMHDRTHHRCYAGHRHRDFPHASLERHLRSRDYTSRPRSHRSPEHTLCAGVTSPRRGTLAPLAAPSGRLRGNGLLTHILISEGYTGYGFDLRARTSWTYYP
jgi:tRNASer (uridine44-2'-O)-methyltransferase